MVWVVILLVLVVMMALLLFMPLVLRIDTRKDLCHVRWGPVHAALTTEGDQVRYRLRVPFWKKEGPLQDLLEPRGGARIKPEKSRRREARSWRPPVRALLGSFQVRHFHWTLDTGDVLWNAWLYPVLHMLRVRGPDLSISFIGRNELALTIDNNLYRLLKAVLFNQRSTIKPQRT